MQHVRWMIRRDMPEVLAIENGQRDRAWSEDDMLRHLRQRHYICMVAEDMSTDAIHGHMVYGLHKRHLHVVRMCGDAAAMDAMLAKLQSKLSSQRRSRLLLDAPDSNLALHLACRRAGMLAIAVDGDEYRFEYQILETAETA